MKLGKKEKIELSVTILSAVLLIFIVTAGISSRHNAAIRAHKANQPQGDITQKNKDLYTSLKKESMEISVFKDPFSREAPPEEKVSPFGLNLSGISWDEAKPTAIINGAIVRIGSRISGYTVVGIKKDRVILNNGFQNVEVTLEK